MPITFESLRCLCAVADAGGFHEAARQLGRSQPAISQQIKGLEAAAGGALVARRGGRLTPLGEVYARRGRELLAARARLEREAADFDEASTHPLRLGASDTYAAHYLPAALGRLLAAHPAARVSVVNRPSATLEAQVLAGTLDLAVVTQPSRSPGLEVRPLFSARLQLAVPAAHRLTARQRVGLPALQGEPYLQLDPDTRTGGAVRATLETAGIAPRVVLDAGSFAVLLGYVAEGLGVALVPAIALRDAAPGIVALGVRGAPTLDAAVVRPAGAYATRLERTLLASLPRGG